MIRKIVREQTPFEKYFSEAPARKPYMKIVSAFPDGRLKSFGDNITADDDIEEELSNIELDDDDLVDDTDFANNITADDDIEEDRPDEGGLETDPPEDDISSPVEDPVEPVTEPESIPETSNKPSVTSTDNSEPTETTSDTDVGLEVEPPTDVPEPVEGGETQPPAEGTEAPAGGGEDVEGGLETDAPSDDFSANMDADTAEDDSMADNAADTSGDDVQKGPANTIDNQLRFSLYRNMKNLYNAVQAYGERLDELTSPSYNFNITTKIANKKLVELEDTMYQYMTVKFKDSDYLVSMNFYQKCVAALMLIFELLRNNKEEHDKDKNEKTKRETLN